MAAAESYKLQFLHADIAEEKHKLFEENENLKSKCEELSTECDRITKLLEDLNTEKTQQNESLRAAQTQCTILADAKKTLEKELSETKEALRDRDSTVAKLKAVAVRETANMEAEMAIRLEQLSKLQLLLRTADEKVCHFNVWMEKIFYSFNIIFCFLLFTSFCFLLLFAFCFFLLFASFCFLLFAFCFLLFAFCFLLFAFCFLLLFAFCFLLFAFCFLLFAFCFLLFAFCFLLFAFCFLLFAFCFVLSYFSLKYDVCYRTCTERGLTITKLEVSAKQILLEFNFLISQLFQESIAEKDTQLRIQLNNAALANAEKEEVQHILTLAQGKLDELKASRSARDDVIENMNLRLISKSEELEALQVKYDCLKVKKEIIVIGFILISFHSQTRRIAE
jgi:hypothetical protein